jgi:thiamine kinase-like enzyme
MYELAQVLARLSAVLGPHGEPVHLDGGITNRNYRVTFGSTDYVVRVPGKNTDVLGIDRHCEWAAAGAAADLGIGPPIGAMLEQPPCLVTRFVDGRALQKEELREPGMLSTVATSLRRMHDSGVTLPATFSPFRVIEHYTREAVARGAPMPDDHKKIAKRARAAESALRGDEHAAVPCHNDLLLANFIRNDGQVCIVDWEYAGMGDRFFDLGNLAVNNDLDEGCEEALLQAYFEEPPSAARLASLRLMRFVSDLRESRWGLLQSTLSEIDFDFEGYAADHAERMARTAAHPDFDRWLKGARAAHA